MTRSVAIARRAYDTWRMRLTLTLTLLVLVAAAFLPGLASGFELEETLKELHPQYSGAVEYRVVQSGGMTLSQAIQSVRSRTGGKILSAETRVQGGREVHHIKVLLKNGKVRTHKVNGRRR